MTDAAPASAALLAAACLHLGFQLTVTMVVYPALVRAPDWATAHALHTRRITPLVALLYGALVTTGAWGLVDDLSCTGTWVGVGGAAASILVTALVAGPTHGRLSAGKDDRLVRRLLVADRVRTAGAVVCAAGALSCLLR